MTTTLTVQLIIDRAKREILADIADGTIPIDVASFSDLHDYVDANCYGGLTEPGVAFVTVDIDEMNDIQAAVDAWIKEGITLDDDDVVDWEELAEQAGNDARAYAKDGY